MLVDDASRDATVEIARELGIATYIHRRNYGYGRNQKTCYRQALKLDADVVVMLHPDYQYTPRLITAMASMVADAQFDVVLGSRILGGCAALAACRFTNTRQPLPDAGAKHFAVAQAFGISHRLSGFQPRRC